MSYDFIREMSVYADGQQTAKGCRLHLQGGGDLSLRPACFLLTVYNPAPSTANQLSTSKALEIRSMNSVICNGNIGDSWNHMDCGKNITEVSFSPGMELWKSVCSLTVPPGLKISDTVKELLRASGTGIKLAGYTGRDPSMPRAQSFFGRTADALTTLAEAAEAKPCLTPAGLVFTGSGEPALFLTEADLLSAPERTKDGILLKTKMKGWPQGLKVKYQYKDQTAEGYIQEHYINADTNEGPWQIEILLA